MAGYKNGQNNFSYLLLVLAKLNTYITVSITASLPFAIYEYMYDIFPFQLVLSWVCFVYCDTALVNCVSKLLFDLGLTSLSTTFSYIATVSGCVRELNAHF